MRKAVISARILLGLAFVLFGANGFLMFLPMPKEAPPPAVATFMAAFMGTYLLKLTAATQLVAGLLLIANRFVPLALILLAPVVVNIILFHLCLDPKTIAPGLVVLALELFLAWAYRRSFAPVLQARAEPS